VTSGNLRRENQEWGVLGCCGTPTPTPTPGLENLGFQTRTQGPKSDFDSDSMCDIMICVLNDDLREILSSSNKRCTIEYKQSFSYKINCTEANLEFSRLEFWSRDVSRPVFTSLGLRILESRSRSRSWSWDLGPWRLGLRHSWSVKLRQNRKSYVKLQRSHGNLPKHLDVSVT